MLSRQAALPSPMLHSANRMDTAPRQLHSPPQGHGLQGRAGASGTSIPLWILALNKADKHQYNKEGKIKCNKYLKVKVLVSELTVQLCLTLCDPMDSSLPGSCVHGILQARILKYLGCHVLLQGIFPTQGSKPGLPHCRQILYRLSHQGSPSF